MPFPNPGGRGQYDSGDYPEALRLATAAIGWDERRASHAVLRQQGVVRGLGVACYIEASGLPSVSMGPQGRRHSAYESATVRIDPSGTVTLASSLMPSGQGHETALAQICASELGIHPDAVRVLLGDTDRCPYSGYGTAASRGMATGGTAALLAAQQVRARILRLASHLLETDEADLTLVDGQVEVRGMSSRRLPLAEVARQAFLAHNLAPGSDPELEARVIFDVPQPIYAYGAATCELEVDVATGEVRLLQLVLADDCGVQINPLLVDGQLAGGVAQGVGGTLLEELRYDSNGQLQSGSLMDYLVPTAGDMPPLRIEHLHAAGDLTPGGFRGAGEAGTLPVPAVVANALMDALKPEGARANVLPFTPERVLAMVRRSGVVDSGRG
jgi:carbon-monoxide dehydrogenase large subunit